MRPEERDLEFALGAMSAEERAELEARRTSDPELNAQLSTTEALVSEMALSNAAAPVPSDLWSRISTEIAQDTSDQSQIVTDLLDEGKWRKLKPKIEVKRLWGGSAHLVRCEAGAVIKAHTHRTEERLMVISGSVHIGDFVLGPGDNQTSPAGSQHGDITTPTGCLFLIQMYEEAA